MLQKRTTKAVPRLGIKERFMKRFKAGVSLLILAALLSGPARVAAADVQAPEPRSRKEIEAVLARAPEPEGVLRQLKILLVAFKKDHGPNEHDYPLWQKRWQLLLGGKSAPDPSEKQVNLYGPAPRGNPDEILAGAPRVQVKTASGWPSKDNLRWADLMVMFCYGGWNEGKLQELEEFLSRGGGFVAVHPAVITDKKLSARLADLIGLAWENGYTGWRHGAMDLKITARDHPICRGLPETIHFLDEAYWPLKGDRKKITVIGASEEAVKDSRETRPEPMFYTYRRGKGRVFSCILGHYTWTFDDPYFRIIFLRGMAWAAGESPYRFDPLALRGIALGD
jgi:type 1 glutamine amidotransferase